MSTKILLFSRPQIAHTQSDIGQLWPLFERYGFDYAINQEFAEVVERITDFAVDPAKIYTHTTGLQPDATLMLCCGGDGTLLEGIHRLSDRSIPVAAINFGHLGFLTSDSRQGLKRLFESIEQGTLRFEERSLIEVGSDLPTNGDSPLALNEFSIQRNGAGMLSVEIYVDEQMVATCHGDGVIVSTPTGSTAYSLSAGGPVVAPSCACFVITPIAPHNLTMRPVVIPDSSTIRLRVQTRRSEAFLTLDNRSYAVPNHCEFTLRKASKSIFLAAPHNISFYDTLRNKMMWGIDIRG